MTYLYSTDKHVKINSDYLLGDVLTDKNNITPFIIDEEHKLFYYRGLKEWDSERGYLLDTCLSAQDKFRAVLAKFNIR